LLASSSKTTLGRRENKDEESTLGHIVAFSVRELVGDYDRERVRVKERDRSTEADDRKSLREKERKKI
jgi:hypothetical protein